MRCIRFVIQEECVPRRTFLLFRLFIYFCSCIVLLVIHVVGRCCKRKKIKRARTALYPYSASASASGPPFFHYFIIIIGHSPGFCPLSLKHQQFFLSPPSLKKNFNPQVFPLRWVCRLSIQREKKENILVFCAGVFFFLFPAPPPQLS